MVFRFFDLCGKKFGDFGSAQSLHCDMRVRILGSMILDSRISICSVGVDNRVNVKHLYLTIKNDLHGLQAADTANSLVK